jgi:hypothetical protein
VKDPKEVAAHPVLVEDRRGSEVERETVVNTGSRAIRKKNRI